MPTWFTKKRGGIAAAVLVLAVLVAYWYIAVNQAPSFSTVAAGRGNVTESVDEAGNVLAENSVTLSFQEPGQIATVSVREGDSVGSGAVLAVLDTSSLEAVSEQANAALAAAQAKLDELMAGTRSEQLQIDKTAITNAQASLAATLQSAYASADDAITNQTDNLFSNPQSSNPGFLISTSDPALGNTIRSERVNMTSVLGGWYTSLSTTSTDPSAASAVADNALQKVESYVNMIALVVNNATVANSGVTAPVLAGYRANVVAARSEVTGVASALAGTEAAYASARDTLALAEAGATPQDIEAQKATVLQAQAAATNAKVVLDHGALIAPFGGRVNNLTAKVGQVVSAGVPVLSLVNNGNLKVETYVSQTDIAKIKEGDATNVTVDAYGTGVAFPATVTTIDTTQTTVNGISAYKVTLHFVNPDSRLKDGMTANVHIIVAEHTNVVTVPSRLVVSDNDNYYVLVAGNNGNEKREVQIGITGNDGMTEITSGLNEGDRIVDF